MTHKLKILPWYFEAVQNGIKNFEIRINDRGFKVGDKLLLQEWHDGKYTGREVIRNVDYMLTDCEGLTDGFVIISWERPTGEWISVPFDTGMGIVDGYKCSVCDVSRIFRSNYCPNCGAKMEEV